MTNSAPTTASEAAGEEELADLLLEVLPGDGSSLGSLSAREALGRVAERPISEEAYEEVKERLLAKGLIRKGRGRAGPSRWLSRPPRSPLLPLPPRRLPPLGGPKRSHPPRMSKRCSGAVPTSCGPR